MGSSNLIDSDHHKISKLSDDEQVEKDIEAVKQMREILEKDKDKRLRSTRMSMGASAINDDEDRDKKD